MPYEIDDNIPLPEAKTRRRYPWIDLTVGQSFFVPMTEKRGNQERTVRSGARLAGIRLKRRFVTRSVEGGLRVWRTE